MSSTEWVVTVLCALLGYALVSWLSDRQKRHEARMHQWGADSADDSAGRGERASSREGHSSQGTRSEAWFQVLEVPASASFEEVRKVYRKKIQQYHPDRLEGMAPELRKLALERSQRLNAAYDEAKRLKADMPGNP